MNDIDSPGNRDVTSVSSSAGQGRRNISFSKVLAAGISAFFVLFGAVSIPLFVVQGTVLRAETYKQALVDEAVYEVVPLILAAQIKGGRDPDPCAQNPAGGGCTLEESIPAFLIELEDSALGVLLTALLPADILQTITEDALDQFFEPLRDPSLGDGVITLRILPLKDHLSGPGTSEAVADIILSQPACSFGDLDQLSLSLLFGEGLTEIPSCSPPERIVREFMPVLQSLISGLVGQIPDEMVVDHPLTSQTSESNGDSLRRVVRIGKMAPLVLVILLGLVALLVIRTWDDFFAWWGTPLLVLGVILIIQSVVGFVSVDGLALTVLRSIWPAGLTPILLETLRNVLSAVLVSAVGQLAFIGLASSLIGAALLGGLRIRRGRVRAAL